MKQLLSEDQLLEGVQRLASEINQHYEGRSLSIVGVLTGSIVLISDLIRRVHVPLRIGLVQASSYRGASTLPGELIVGLNTLTDIEGRDVLIVDDIFDTGHTLDTLVKQLKAMRPASLRCAVLLRKHGRKAVSMEPDHVAFEIPNVFVVGYGLDYQDEYRNLPYIAALDDEVSAPAG